MRIRNIIITFVSLSNLFLYGNKFDSKGDFKMFLDTYQYNGSNDSTIVELSYSIDLSYLDYIFSKDYHSSMFMHILVESTHGIIL